MTWDALKKMIMLWIDDRSYYKKKRMTLEHTLQRVYGIIDEFDVLGEAQEF